MKRILLLAAVIVTAMLFTAARKAEQQAEDLFRIMGISKEEAQVLMRENLLYASMATPSVVKLKNIAEGKRADMVRDLGSYMKSYFKTKEVAEAYHTYRESIMPGKQEGIDVKARIEEIKDDIRKTEEDKKHAPADMKALYEQTITELKKQLAILQDPKHPEYSLYAGFVELSPEQKQELDRQVKEFSKEYPEDVQQYVKVKLREFLELSSDIDFNAKLVQKNGKWRFQDPMNEARDYNWKKCFRAGKEAVEAARAFAEQWLREIK